MANLICDGSPARRSAVALRLLPVGLDFYDLRTAVAMFGRDIDLLAYFVGEEGLGECALVADDAPIRVAVPGPEDGVSVFATVAGFAEGNDGSDRDLGGVGIRKVSAARESEVTLGLGTAPAEHALHFFRGLEFKVFAQIAVAASDADLFYVLGDFLVHEFVVVGLALLQARRRPANRPC